MAIMPRSFFLVNACRWQRTVMAMEPVGVALEDCPPVLEYTSVSSTSTLTS